MRSFLDILSPPAGSPSSPRRTSSAAIAAVVLDDAGLDPVALTQGVTVIRSENAWVTDAILWLVKDALRAADVEVVMDRFEAVWRGQVALIANAGGRLSVADDVETALANDAAFVLAATPESVGTWILDVTDREIFVPDRLTDAQVGRVVALVCPPEDGETADVSGLGADLTLLDIVKIVRKGYKAADVADRLRKCVAGRRKALADIAKVAEKAFAGIVAKFGLGDRLVDLDDQRAWTRMSSPRSILSTGRDHAAAILGDREQDFLRLADTLIVRRYLDADEVREVLEGDTAHAR